MKKLFTALFAITIGLGLVVSDAEAKRFGGGRSSGLSRDSSVMQRQAAPATPAAPVQNAAAPARPGATPQAPAPQPSGMSRWLGPIAGLAAGIGLAALLSHFGFGEGMANVVMILLLVMAAVFVIRLLARKSQAGRPMQFAGAPATPMPNDFSPAPSSLGGGTAPSVPANFDVDGFLRQAKLNFIRLQAANDSGNLDDIRQFTSPEMFAEIKLQWEERGKSAQQTDVMQVDASLLDLAYEAQRHVASVRFHGLIREDGLAQPEAFSEVWHLVKPVDGSSGWVVAGIQQDR